MFILTQLKVESWITSKFDYVCFTYFEWCINSVTCIFSIKRTFAKFIPLNGVFVVSSL